MVKKTTIVKEFYFIETNSTNNKATDVSCRTCGYTGRIKFDDDYLDSCQKFANPNYELIMATFDSLVNTSFLIPETIKFINDDINAFCCPACNKATLDIVETSQYNLKHILESLECHRI